MLRGQLLEVKANKEKVSRRSCTRETRLTPAPEDEAPTIQATSKGIASTAAFSTLHHSFGGVNFTEHVVKFVRTAGPVNPEVRELNIDRSVRCKLCHGIDVLFLN